VEGHQTIRPPFPDKPRGHTHSHGRTDFPSLIERLTQGQKLGADHWTNLASRIIDHLKQERVNTPFDCPVHHDAAELPAVNLARKFLTRPPFRLLPTQVLSTSSPPVSHYSNVQTT